MLLSAEHISKNYALKELLNDVSFYLDDGDRVGIIGINGAGKSTFLKILAGEEQPDAGSVTRMRGVQLAYLPQNPKMPDDATALEYVLSTLPAEYREVSSYEVREMLTRLGMPDPTAKLGTMSGGERRRVALAAVLVSPADVLILDEPTNHLDSDMTIWLEERLRKFTGGLVMVTHDRYFLERVTGKIAELSHGKIYTYEANYSKYLELRAARIESEFASERKRQAILRREYEWISRGVRARGTKSRERIERYYALKEQDAPQLDATVKISAASSRMGKKLIELRGVSKSFGDRTVVRDFTYNLERDARIGIVGRNGAGKSTLCSLISGTIEPTSGEIERGSTIKIGYFTQEGRELDPEMRVYDYITEIAREVKTSEGTFSASQMLERFLFPGEQQHSPIGKLSGGERRRLYLLGVLAAAPNVLILDEPTNDLDIETLTILEDYLEDFPGAVIAVSHDRYFLDKMADNIFEVAEGGEVRRYIGGFTDYLEKRPPRAEPAAEKTAAPAEKPAAPAPRAPRPQKLRMSFKEQREFETIDADIEALENRIAECEAECAAAASDYAKLMDATARLEALKTELDEKTERWVYLNELAEKIANQ